MLRWVERTTEWKATIPLFRKTLQNGERSENGEILMYRWPRWWWPIWQYRRATWEEIREYQRRHMISP
jgi:hypothetical protein